MLMSLIWERTTNKGRYCYSVNGRWDLLAWSLTIGQPSLSIFLSMNMKRKVPIVEISIKHVKCIELESG